ncbi:hypothetical protein ACA910_022624 [Epithemia clementina (nom. ined.)]
MARESTLSKAQTRQLLKDIEAKERSRKTIKFKDLLDKNDNTYGSGPIRRAFSKCCSAICALSLDKYKTLLDDHGVSASAATLTELVNQANKAEDNKEDTKEEEEEDNDNKNNNNKEDDDDEDYIDDEESQDIDDFALITEAAKNLYISSPKPKVPTRKLGTPSSQPEKNDGRSLTEYQNI